MRDNRTKRIMRAGGLALGVSITIPDPFVAEVIGGAGFDFVLIDTEHAPITVDQLQLLLIALRTSESTVFVRPAANDPTLIKQILDLGAEGVVVPEVGDATACADAIAAARYPPLGRRGFGPRRAARLEGGRPAYIARANDEVAVLVMVESANAVAAIDALLQTPGLDGIMVGRRTWRFRWAIWMTSTTLMSAPGSPTCVPRASGTRSRSGYSPPPSRRPGGGPGTGPPS